MGLSIIGLEVSTLLFHQPLILENLLSNKMFISPENLNRNLKSCKTFINRSQYRLVIRDILIDRNLVVVESWKIIGNMIAMC